MRLWTALAKQALGGNQIRQLSTTSRVMSKRLEGKVLKQPLSQPLLKGKKQVKYFSYFKNKKVLKRYENETLDSLSQTKWKPNWTTVNHFESDVKTSRGQSSHCHSLFSRVRFRKKKVKYLSYLEKKRQVFGNTLIMF